MERDCMISHGASAMLEERLCGVSDKFQIPVCKHCGIITSSFVECQSCHGDDVLMCKIPYAAKQLFKELECMGIELCLKPAE